MKYEETAYDTSSETDTVNAISFLFEAKNNCAKEKNQTEANRCHETIEKVLNRHFSALDLAAQHTTAKATRGLLWISAIQAMTGFATALFLFWTVRQTKLILDQSTAATNAADATLVQANKTTDLARDSLTQTRRAADAEYQPYFRLRVDRCESQSAISTRIKLPDGTFYDRNPDGIGLTISIENYGRTPAHNLWCEIRRKDSIFYRRTADQRTR